MIPIARDILPFSAIKQPLPYILDLWNLHHPPFKIENFSSLLNGHQIFSRQAALAMSEYHPLIVTENTYHCICNPRLLKILTTRLNPDDNIPVGIIPASTDPDLIQQFVLTEILLSTMTYASNMPEKDIFNFSKTLPSSLIEKFTPALAQNILTRAKLLGTVKGTLYKWLADKK